MNDYDNEGTNSKSSADTMPEYTRPEDRVAADGSRWQDLVDDDDDDTQPTPTLMSILSDQAFVLMQQATIAGQQGAIERLNARIAELETAIEAMVQAAYEADEYERNHWCAVIMDIGREALGK